MRIKFPISLSKESYKSPQGHNTFRIQKNRAEGLACSVLSLIILDILKFPIVFFIFYYLVFPFSIKIPMAIVPNTATNVVRNDGVIPL